MHATAELRQPPHQANGSRRELAHLLMQLRNGVKPEAVGLRGTGRRRVSGLRREELADVAGISVTWYTCLEQARDVHASPRAIDAIARALGVDESVRRHLRVLAGLPLDVPSVAHIEVDDSLAAFVQEMSPEPALITSPASDVLVWNEAYSKVYIDLEQIAPECRNNLWISFMSREFRERIFDWETEARFAVARHREVSAPYAADPRVRDIRAMLLQESADFRRLWNEPLVSGFSPRTQMLDHPVAGRLAFNILQMRPTNNPTIKLVIRRAADAATLERLRKLLSAPRTIPTQRVR